MAQRVKIGFIPANRGFFSNALAAEMRAKTIEALEQQDIEVVVPNDTITNVGCVEGHKEAKIVGKMFRDAGVDGILVGAVNFGDESGVALTVKEADLNVPIMIYGAQETGRLSLEMERRDSFCGLLSIGDVLRQIGAKYSVARVPICYPTDDSFSEDVSWFAGVCRVVKGVRNARYGQIGARPDNFWTCRFNERALQERLGVTTVVMDLSEAIGKVSRMADDDKKVRAVLDGIGKYTDTSAMPSASLLRIAKFEVVMRDFVEEMDLVGLAIQCWTSLQQNLGICACTSMSRMGNEGVPCACEADINGLLSMHALLLAGNSPAGLADWNNLSVDDPEVCNLWHCGVFPKALFGDRPTKMGIQTIIAATVGDENACGVMEGSIENGPLTISRVTIGADDQFKVFIAQGAVESTRNQTFGAGGWVRVPGLQRAYRDILVRHFPHHVGLTRGNVGDILYEAFGNYLGMQTFVPDTNVDGTYRPGLPFAEGKAAVKA
ncbi:MAG: L-fucose/L-arabinose isomerase family protein [Armatimonadota bacterium]